MGEITARQEDKGRFFLNNVVSELVHEEMGFGFMEARERNGMLTQMA